MAKYTYHTLSKMCRHGQNTPKSDNPHNALEIQLRAAAGYAVDLIEAAKSNHSISLEEKTSLLEVSVDGNEAALTAAVPFYFSEKGTVENRFSNLTKLLGSYQLFALCNFFEIPKLKSFGITATPFLQATPILSSSPYAPLDSLVLEIRNENDDTILFDVYANMWESLRKDSRCGDMLILGIPSFHEAFRCQVLEKIMDT